MINVWILRLDTTFDSHHQKFTHRNTVVRTLPIINQSSSNVNSDVMDEAIEEPLAGNINVSDWY